MNGRWGTIGFVVLMLLLTALFVGLGVWQIERLGEKEALIAAVSERPTLPPVDLPPPTDWGTLDLAALDYRSVTVHGTYEPAQTVLVFTSLVDPRGTFDGPGYWVMTPLRLDGGGVVFVNRGFVPQDRTDDFAAGQGAAAGPVALTGLARVSEAASTFTPAADRAGRVDWLRNAGRLAQFLPANEGPVIDLTIDLPAGAPGDLPQGGETVMSFPNNHLGYIITWFGFALITPILLAVWLWRRRRHPQPA